jgi:hypothetical protein
MFDTNLVQNDFFYQTRGSIIYFDCYMLYYYRYVKIDLYFYTFVIIF